MQCVKRLLRRLLHAPPDQVPSELVRSTAVGDQLPDDARLPRHGQPELGAAPGAQVLDQAQRRWQVGTAGGGMRERGLAGAARSGSAQGQVCGGQAPKP